MLSTYALAAVTLFSLCARADSGVSLRGWKVGGTTPDNYGIALDRNHRIEGASSVRMASLAQRPLGFVTLVQSISAEVFRGKRVRFATHIRSEGVTDYSGLWFRVEDAAGSVLAFDDMKKRSVKGDTDWHVESTVLDVPADAAVLIYGSVLQGAGAIWIDNASFEAVDVDVPTTGESVMPQQNRAKEFLNLDIAPSNLGFEP